MMEFSPLQLRNGVMLQTMLYFFFFLPANMNEGGTLVKTNSFLAVAKEF